MAVSTGLVSRASTKTAKSIQKQRGAIIERDTLIKGPLSLIDHADVRTVVFERCTFSDNVRLERLKLDEARFIDCDFAGGCGDLVIERCDIQSRLEIITEGAGATRLDDGTFVGLNPRRYARWVAVRNSTLSGGALIVVWSHAVNVRGARFMADSLLQRALKVTDANDLEAVPEASVPLTSLSFAEVSHLWIDDIDLSWCSMRRARGLEHVTFLSCRWPNAKAEHRATGETSVWQMPRRIVYDEVRWRRSSSSGRKRRKNGDATWATWRQRKLHKEDVFDERPALSTRPGNPAWPPPPSVPTLRPNKAPSRGVLPAWQVADQYLALERAAARMGNHAPAADLMWGAYTMRRLAGRERLPAKPPQESFFRGGQSGHRLLWRTRAGRADRVLIIAYRLVAGYGLRARWPLAWIVVLLTATHLMLGLGEYGDGAASSPPLPTTTGRQAATTLASTLPTSKTPEGFSPEESLLISFARGAEVIFLGFAALALRSRVRR